MNISFAAAMFGVFSLGLASAQQSTHPAPYHPAPTPELPELPESYRPPSLPPPAPPALEPGIPNRYEVPPPRTNIPDYPVPRTAEDLKHVPDYTGPSPAPTTEKNPACPTSSGHPSCDRGDCGVCTAPPPPLLASTPKPAHPSPPGKWVWVEQQIPMASPGQWITIIDPCTGCPTAAWQPGCGLTYRSIGRWEFHGY